VRLETERLVLRELVPDDFDEIFAWQSDPRWLRYYEWTERKPDECRELLDRMIGFQREQPRTKFQLAVELKDRRGAIGTCGIRMDRPEATEADIGYEITPDHWGRGYAREAVRAVVEFGIEELKVHRIWSWCVADNTASWRLMEKLGMKREGRLRDKHYFKGRFWDELVYGMLADEYRR
jgi:ribosomal-protein-alanine N-acetyltransferase